MKRFLVLLILAVFTAGALVTAEDAVLIDFSTLAADQGSTGLNGQNGKTLVDYSEIAGTSFSKDEKALMKTSLAIGQWEVKLASSSKTIDNQAFSYTKEAKITKDVNEDIKADATVMGIRVHFPTVAVNSYAIVQPPFEIPAYADVQTLQEDGTLVTSQEEKGNGAKFDNIGVVKNVGVLKSVSVNVRGLNFPHGLSLVLKDADNVEHQIFMDYLDFDGWKTLKWENPNYITEVRNRELHKFALYPKSTPLVKLVGIVINKDASMEGGDFITYVKDIKVSFDKAVLSLDREIEDEAIWNIFQKQEEKRRTLELSRLGKLQVMRYIEKQKMDQEAQ